MQVADIYPHNTMHRLPTLEHRNKLKTNNSTIYSTRPRSLSALSLIQPSQLHARATSVVRKVIGTRLPLKEADLFIAPIERHSCDKPRSSADSTRPEISRPRSNTTPTESTWPKDITATSPHHETVSAPSDATGPTQQLHLPLDSLLFSPTPDSPPSEDLQEMETTPARTRPVITSSPEMYDSGYASGQSSAAGSAFPMPNASPTMSKSPRTAGRPGASPLTPGGMNMRMSPSVPRSMMPMPILNLPPLPATPAPDHTLPRTRSLQPGEMRHVKKSMPALMRHGTSNMPIAHHEEDDDDDGDDGSSGSDSDSSETEDTLATGDSSPEARDSIESIQESTEHSSSEDADYFDARETHTPATEQPPHVVSGPNTPRASEQNRNLPEASALGLQTTPGPSAISGSPWTLVDNTPGADRYTNGHGSRMDYFSHPVTTARQILKSPRRTPRIAQLAALASPSKVNVTTPRANPPPLSPIDTIATRRARAATVLRDVGEPPRPALYQQVSQSMMNLSSPTTEGLSLSGFDALRSPLRTPRDGLPAITATPGSPPPMLTPLMRRNSMPTLIRHPPEYKDLYPSIPREEEGKEKLPPYSCGIHIEAMMPRKMEFTAPGVLAKDRGWKKQYIVIHGTSLFVYKNDIRKVPIGGKVKGKEKYEGVVTEDEVDLNLPTVHLPGYEPAAPRPPLTTTPRRASRPSSNGTSECGSTSRSSLLSRFHGNSSRSTIPPQQEPAPFDDKGSASQSTTSVNTNSSGSTSKRWSHNQASGSFASSLPHFNPPFSSGNALLRHYTLQKSESGLGSDYYKRRNVIRVRCEGEQFLLQAESVMQVVDWIEALQAGTNVALDLDERPMTKPPPFPRRRRRRRVRPADGTGDGQATTPGANASNDNANQ